MKKLFKKIKEFQFLDENGVDAFKESQILSHFKDFPVFSKIILFFMTRSNFTIKEYYLNGQTHQSLDQLCNTGPLEIKNKYKFTFAFKYSSLADSLWIRF